MRVALLAALCAALGLRTASAQILQPGITSPHPGQVLQGAVTVTGTSQADGFTSMEVAFAYAEDPTDTWFVLEASTEPVVNGTLAVWDTTTITDGDYRLRLRIHLTDGTFIETVNQALRVRNYSPVETPSPTAPAGQTNPRPATSTPLPHPTPTPLPPNPAALSSSSIYASLGYGALIVAALFLLFGFYTRLRRH